VRLLWFSVASYDSQGDGGGILTSPHMSSQSHLTNDGQSASLSWYQTTIGDPRPFFLFHGNFLQIFAGFLGGGYWAPSLTRGRASNLLVEVLVGLASAVTVGSNFRRTRTYILLSYLRLGSLSEVEVSLRPTVSEPVYLGVGPCFGAHDQILYFLLLV
jgi:hypothetical protein